MKLGMIITQTDPETVFNALRLALYSLEQRDEVRIFLSGKGVEIDQIEDPKFDVKGQAQRVGGLPAFDTQGPLRDRARLGQARDGVNS